MTDTKTENPEDALLTVTEVADRLRVSRGKVYDLCREEGFPSIRVGGLYRVRSSDLDGWLEAQKLDV